MYTHTHETMDRMTNLLISSNVHYVHLGGDNDMQRFKQSAIFQPKPEIADRQMQLLFHRKRTTQLIYLLQ